MGDFNAHNDLWHSEITGDQRGDTIADAIDNSEFGVLNDPVPTRIMGTTKSSPDITLASASLFPNVTWKVEIALPSDHLPITITINRKIQKSISSKRTFVNFSKADWVSYTSYVEDEISKIGSPVDVCTGF